MKFTPKEKREIWAEVRNLLSRIAERFDCDRPVDYVRALEKYGIKEGTVQGLIRESFTPAITTYQRLLEAANMIIVDSETLETAEGKGDDSLILPMEGYVSAGSGTFSYNENRSVLRSFEGLFRKSPRWGLGTGPAFAIQVRGDAMVPEYPDRSYIVCRDIADPKKIPDGTPCILQEKRSDEMTFKALHHVRKGSKTVQLIGMPLNPTHSPLAWSPSEVSVLHVAVAGIVL